MSMLTQIQSENNLEFQAKHKRFMDAGGYSRKPSCGISYKQVYGRAWRVACRLNRVEHDFYTKPKQ